MGRIEIRKMLRRTIRVPVHSEDPSPETPDIGRVHGDHAARPQDGERAFERSARIRNMLDEIEHRDRIEQGGPPRGRLKGPFKDIKTRALCFTRGPARNLYAAHAPTAPPPPLQEKSGRRADIEERSPRTSRLLHPVQNALEKRAHRDFVLVIVYVPEPALGSGEIIHAVDGARIGRHRMHKSESTLAAAIEIEAVF